MKKVIFIFSLVLCLFCVPFTGFAAPTEEEKQQYEDAIAENRKEMLKGSISLDQGNASIKTYLLNWLEAEKQPKEAKKIVSQIEKLQEEQEKAQENMDPYMQAKKACDEKLNADGANAALKNIIRIQKNRIKDQDAVIELWKKVDEILKK